MFAVCSVLALLGGIAQIDQAPVPGQTARASPTAAQPDRELPAFSTDLLDPDGFSRFHLVTRATFSNGDSVFSNSSAWSSEVRAHLRFIEGLAISAVLPIGFYRTAAGATREGFVGNIAFGAGGGLVFDLAPNDDGARRFEVRAGAGLDLYLPSAPSGEAPEQLAAELAIAAIRSSEPQLYIPRLLSFRTRVYGDIQAGPLQAGLELGLVPGWTVKAPSQSLILVAFAARASVEATETFEPYVEAGCAKQISGDGDVSPPFLVTTGLRMHLSSIFDPAVFASFNFITPSAIIFGLDLASAFRTRQKPPREENRDDFEDFLDLD